MRSVSLRHQWVTGWNSTRWSRPPGRSSRSTTRAHSSMSGQPAQRADARVDAVEGSTTQSGRRVVDVGHDELRVERRRERRSRGPRRWRAPRGRRPRPARRAAPNPSVSMPKWHWRWTRSRPSTSPASSPRSARSGVQPAEKALDTVEVGADVHRHPLVPPGAVELEPRVVHGPILPRYAQRPPHPREGRTAAAAGEDWAGGNSPRCLAPYGLSGSERNKALQRSDELRS